MSTNLKLEDVFDTINNCARAGREAPEIISLLENKFSYNYKYINKLFRDKYRLTIRECIKNEEVSILFGCHIDDILVHNMTGEDESPLLPLYEEFGRTWRLCARSFFQLHGECNLRLTSLEWLYRQ